MKKLHLSTRNQWQRKVLLTGLGLSWSMTVWAISPPTHGEPDDKRKPKPESEKTLSNSVAVVISKKNDSSAHLKSKSSLKKKTNPSVLLPMVLPAPNLHY